MPSLILTGYPSAGKTTVSKVLKERALQHETIKDVVIINEETACPDWTKHECYATSLAEKKTRAALKSAFDRAVAISNKKTLVVLDSLNYIKGFRYELHCISKAAGERHGILWILNQASVVQEWNENRPSEKKEQESYSKELLLELIQRYEPPDERNRWDKPMYSVDVAPCGNVDSKSEAVTKSVYNMHSLGESLAAGQDKETNTTSKPAETAAPMKKKSAFSRSKRKTSDPPTTNSNVTAEETTNVTPSSATQQLEQTSLPTGTQNANPSQETHSKSLEDQLDEILNAFLSSKELKQGASTQQHIAVSANVLSEMDAITTRLVSAISSAQTIHTGGKLQVPFGGSTHAMNCPRTAALPELRRLRRQYLQWVSTHPPDDTSEKGIAEAFLKYLEDQLK
jgi:protein KTI12